MGWKGKRVVVTGATRGVGYHTTLRFLAAGACVVGTGKDGQRLKAVEAEFQKKGDFVGVKTDWEDRAAPKTLFDAVAKRWDSVDVLCNNAAVQTWKKDWYDEGLDLLEQHFRINVLAPHELIYRFVPLLEKGQEPRIINVGSGAGNFQSLSTQADMPTYRLTKYTLGGVTLLWAAQLKGKIAVNLLDPGWLKTDLGGPNAPGEPEDGGQRIWEACELPWEQTGKFWYGNQEIPF